MNSFYAYPHLELNDDGTTYQQFQGLTVRDYFAAQAMMGIQARYSHTPMFTADEAYKIADAMLEHREVR